MLRPGVGWLGSDLACRPHGQEWPDLSARPRALRHRGAGPLCAAATAHAGVVARLLDHAPLRAARASRARAPVGKGRHPQGHARLSQLFCLTRRQACATHRSAASRASSGLRTAPPRQLAPCTALHGARRRGKRAALPCESRRLPHWLPPGWSLWVPRRPLSSMKNPRASRFPSPACSTQNGVAA